ncbi:hypothetical protein [Treponema putidum]|uniref:hypothetical protein n=1 Tax=Treponema putidum TaxID=221027 RepID=UPI002103293C|nr:hypothetical protein [Treponema putidum]
MSKFKMQKASAKILDKLIKPVSSITGSHNEGFLVTAGSGTEKGKWNTMTAGWGNIGFLWNKLTATVYIRPTRYTAEFADKEDYITLSFFDENDPWAKGMLAFCGTVSGRNVDKAKETGLKPVMLEDGAVSFEQAQTVLVCRKLYRSKFDMDLFVDPQIVIDSYPKKDFHYVYICEIVSVYTK